MMIMKRILPNLHGDGSEIKYGIKKHKSNWNSRNSSNNRELESKHNKHNNEK